MASTLKIAVISTGWWATTAHNPGLLEHPQVEVVIIERMPCLTTLNLKAAVIFTTVSLYR
jgi:predicted dehydrogenase